MFANQQRLTLYQPAAYQIKVSGQFDESWSDWAGEMTVTSASEDDLIITTLTGTVDQAGLLGLLRRFYSLGLPLISFECLEV